MTYDIAAERWVEVIAHCSRPPSTPHPSNKKIIHAMEMKPHGRSFACINVLLVLEYSLLQRGQFKPSTLYNSIALAALERQSTSQRAVMNGILEPAYCKYRKDAI